MGFAGYMAQATDLQLLASLKVNGWMEVDMKQI
jgi:hypothetical protein